jgi:hypothetical protein
MEDMANYCLKSLKELLPKSLLSFSRDQKPSSPGRSELKFQRLCLISVLISEIPSSIEKILKWPQKSVGLPAGLERDREHAALLVKS